MCVVLLFHVVWSEGLLLCVSCSRNGWVCFSSQEEGVFTIVVVGEGEAFDREMEER